MTQRLLTLLEAQLLVDAGFALDHKVFKDIAHRRLAGLRRYPGPDGGRARIHRSTLAR